jgi:PAS domain S-box-containing protein
MIKNDGSMFWAQLNSIKTGSTSRTTITDITERKQTEEALQQEQVFSKSVIESLPGVFFLYNYPECRLQMWNKRHEDELGYTAEELKNKYVLDFHAPEIKNSIMSAIESVIQTGYGSANDILVTKEGKQVPYLSTAVKFESQGKQYFMGLCTDITENASLFNAMKTILDGVNLMIWAKDINHKYTFVNKQYREFLGLEIKDILGKKFEDFVQVDDGYSANSTDKVAEKEIFVDTISVVYKGVRYWLSVCKSPLINEHGIIVGTVGTAKNITDVMMKKEKSDLALSKLTDEIESGIVAWKSEREAATMEVKNTINEIRKNILSGNELATKEDYWGKIL